MLMVRLTPLAMSVEWPPSELWSAPVESRRLTAAAGSVAQVAFGAILVGVGTLYADQWAAVVRETLFLCGVFHIAAVVNLVPVAPSDGHIFFGFAWRTRPAWLSVVVTVLLALLSPLALTAAQFEQGYVRAYLTSFIATGGLVPLAGDPASADRRAEVLVSSTVAKRPRLGRPYGNLHGAGVSRWNDFCGMARIGSRWRNRRRRAPRPALRALERVS